jgi:hypothetical protein
LNVGDLRGAIDIEQRGGAVVRRGIGAVGIGVAEGCDLGLAHTRKEQEKQAERGRQEMFFCQKPQLCEFVLCLHLSILRF